MCAACTSLLYLICFTLRLEGYFGYVLPLPTVLMAMRHGSKSGWHTLGLTALLQTVLFGPVKAADFALKHGLYSAALASCWLRAGAGSLKDAECHQEGAPRMHWLSIVLLVALVRGAGLIGTGLLYSWILGDNLFSLLVFNVENMLGQFFPTRQPHPALIASMLLILTYISSLLYVALIYIVQANILSKCGVARIPLPAYLKRSLDRTRTASL